MRNGYKVNIEFMRAQHRFLADFCGQNPHRLKSMIGVNARYIEASVAEIKHWMEDQAHDMGCVAENLQHTMLEYTMNGRFFASIVLHEGGKMVQMVSDYLGDHLLMFSTDYPHPESRFPSSVALALG